MKIVIASEININPFLKYWGIRNNAQKSNPTWINNLIEGLANISDVEIHVISESPYIPYDKDIMESNIYYHFLKSAKRLRWRLGTLYYFDIRRIVKKIHEIKPDIIHAHFNLEYNLAAIRSGYPFVVTVHALMWKIIEHDGFQFSFKIQEILQIYALKKSYAVICVSSYVEKQLKNRNYDAEYFILPNAISLKYFNYKNKGSLGRRQLLYIGGVQPGKNLLLAVKAIPLVKEKFPSIKLRVAGPVGKIGKAYFESILTFIKENKIQENVDFLGYCDEKKLKEELETADILVHPSTEETFCMVVFEAMASGVPVICTPVGALPEYIDEGRNGLFISGNDHIDFARKIIGLLSNDGQREIMGRLGRETVLKELHPLKIAKKHINIYERIIDKSVGI